jgi:SAM-dependent methyltransferase
MQLNVTTPSSADGPAYGASEHYNAEYFAYQNAGIHVKVRYQRMRFAAHVEPTDVVLDFGCAAGTLLASLTCAERIGVEINPLARELADRRGIKTYETLSEVPDRVADVLISSHTLEHVPNPYTALVEMRAKLRVDGKLVLLLPLDDWRRGKRYDAAEPNHHLYGWTPQLLGNLLVEAGYSVRAHDIALVRGGVMMRHFEKFDAAIPRPIFDQLCKAWSYVRLGQEIVAVAYPAA